MAISPLSKNLKLLIGLDQSKKKILSQIKKTELEIEEDKCMLPELDQTVAGLKQEVLNLKKNVNLQELKANSLKEQELQKRKTLSKIKNQKEYAAAEKELSSILQQLSEQDDALMKAWHDLEIAQKKEAEDLVTLKEKIELLKKDIAEKENAIVELKKQDQELEQKRNEQTANIPSEWLTKYDRMKDKVDDPIIPVIHSSCSSCYYSVPPKDMVRLKHNALLPCRSCYRFLYYDQEEEKDSENASF